MQKTAACVIGWMGCYTINPRDYLPIFKSGAGICAVPTGDVVTTG